MIKLIRCHVGLEKVGGEGGNNHSLGHHLVSSQASSEFESKMALTWSIDHPRSLTKIHYNIPANFFRVKGMRFLTGEYKDFRRRHEYI